MPKTERELAFLRDLYITEDFTRRFTELVDKHLSLASAENVLYLNAGTGTHCLALAEAAGSDTSITAKCENQELLNIVRDKAAALRAEINISTGDYNDDSFDMVIADGSLVPAPNIVEFVNEVARVASPGGTVLVMLPTAGSYGEIFSLLWEVLLDQSSGSGENAANELIGAIPSRSKLEEIAKATGLEKIEIHIANEIFEYEDGAAFAAAPLVTDHLIPEWFKGASDERMSDIMSKLSALIDSEDGDLAFRFSVKATLLKARKAYVN